MSTPNVSKRTDLFPSGCDDFFKPWDEWFDSPANRWNPVLQVPAVNVMETDEYFRITLAVPGIEKEQLHIDIEGNMLTISARSVTASSEKFTHKEYSYASFRRSIGLPADIQLEKITASYHNGELTLLLPKADDTRQRVPIRIAVS